MLQLEYTITTREPAMNAVATAEIGCDHPVNVALVEAENQDWTLTP